MLSETILKALEIQMMHEYNNSYIYKSFSSIADYQGLIGTTKWFDIQSKEEYGHFDKLFNYLCDQGAIPHLGTIPEIKPQIYNLQELFTQTVALEKLTLEKLKMLANVCKEEKDDQSYELALWYLKEQVEEVKTVDDILKRVIMSANNLLLIDNELGQR